MAHGRGATPQGFIAESFYLCAAPTPLVAACAPLLTPLVAACAPLLTPLMATSAPLLTPLHPGRLGLSI